jgi:hypothetical protein
MTIIKYLNTEQRIIRNRKNKDTSDIFYNTMSDYARENMNVLMRFPKGRNFSDLEDTVMSLGYV